MIFSKDTYNDIKKYYTNCYIKLKESGDRLWKIVSITQQEIKLQDVDGFIIYLTLDNSYEVDYPLPARALFQDGSRAALLYRTGAKQYYRGANTENTRICVLNSGGHPTDVGLVMTKLQQFCDKPAYLKLDDLVSNDEYETVAISPQFWVDVSNHPGQWPIYCLRKGIGYAYPETKSVKVHSLFVNDIAKLTSWEVTK